MKAKALAGLVFVGALALGACGGDDSKTEATSAPSASAAAPTTAAAGGASASTEGGVAPTETTVSGGDTTGSGTDATTADSITVDTNFTGKGSGDICSFAKEVEDSQQFDKLFENGSDKEQTKKGYEALKAAYATMIAKAPSEIKDDLRTSAKAVESLFGLLEKYDYDFTKLMTAAQSDPNVQKELEAMNTPEFEAANQRVSAYFEKVCGLDGGSSDTTATTAG